MEPEVRIIFSKITDKLEKEALSMGATFIDPVVEQVVMFDCVIKARLFLEAIESGTIDY